MIKSETDPFLKYYHRELSYLHNTGALFAQKHPKIARRLEIDAHGESQDPHVERLLESFAFLTARVSQEIDDRLPQMATALLSVLAPQLIAPIPAMSVAQFVVDPTKGKLTTGFDVPKETPLFVNAEEGVACRFRTGYPVTLWPIEVIAADFIASNAPLAPFLPAKENTSPWLLRLKLKAQGVSFSELDLRRLTFYINGDHIFRTHIYECIFAKDTPHAFVKEGDGIKEVSVRALGFDDDEWLLPCPHHVHPAYQLLMEYFHFSKKFFFWEVNGLDTLHRTDLGNEMDIFIPIHNPHITDKTIDPSHFLLGCTPIINLFHKITDPLRLDHRKLEYPLSPDQRRERTTEIYQILEVTAAHDDNLESQPISPYFSFNHSVTTQSDSLFWVSRRVLSDRRDIPGTDVMLSFVDLAFNPNLPPAQIIYAETLCTNRFLADQVPAGAELQWEEQAPISTIRCLHKPVSQVYTPREGESLWKLISSLAMNHLSLNAGQHSVDALKEVMHLYAGPLSSYRHGEIEAIQGLETRSITRRVGDQAWRGFLAGLEITLTIDEKYNEGSSPFLLGAVLNHVLGMQVSVNSFVEVALHSPQRKREWMRWQPRSGSQPLL